jgi:hypothetical protein
MTALTRRQTLIGAAATVAAASLPAHTEAAAEPITHARDPIIRSTDEGWENHPVPVSVIVESPFPVPSKLVCPVWREHDTTYRFSPRPATKSRCASSWLICIAPSNQPSSPPTLSAPWRNIESAVKHRFKLIGVGCDGRHPDRWRPDRGAVEASCRCADSHLA